MEANYLPLVVGMDELARFEDEDMYKASLSLLPEADGVMCRALKSCSVVSYYTFWSSLHRSSVFFLVRFCISIFCGVSTPVLAI